MIKKNILIALSLIMIAVTVLGCSSQPSEVSDNTGEDSNSTEIREAIVLKAVTAWPQQVKDTAGFFALQEIVNESGEGKVKIEYLGGPEVVSTMELFNAVKNGTVDIGWLSAGYTVSTVPAANAVKLSTYNPWEERENGIYDLWDEIFRKQGNAHFLGRGIPKQLFHLYTTKPIETLDDFQGMSIRVTASYKDFATALKASPVTMDPGEVYTALERGVVDAYGWPGYGIADMGWDELTTHVVDPGFYQVDPICLINLDKWNSLPDDVQEIITKSAEEMEREMAGYFQNVFEEDREFLKSKGIKIVQLSESDAEKYLDMAYEAVWNEVLKTAPEYGARVKETMRQ